MFQFARKVNMVQISSDQNFFHHSFFKDLHIKQMPFLFKFKVTKSKFIQRFKAQRYSFHLQAIYKREFI